MRFSRSVACLFVAPLVVIAACGVDEAGTADPGIEGGTTEGGGGGGDGSIGTDGSISTDGSKTDGSSSDGGDASTKCGADSGVSCPVGATCATDDDCEGKCTATKCATPTHTDGKVSPSIGETDIDCGGATAPKCVIDLACKVDTDCATAACSAGKKCIPPSCKVGGNGTSGLETCGAGEAASESCCRSLPLPTRTTRRLDKYEITAGRVRSFIDGVSAANGGVPNVRAFATAYAASHPGSQLADVVDNYPGLIDVLPDHAGPTGANPLPYHLGAAPLDPINSLDGCYVGEDAYGHATYWQPASDLKPLGVGYPGADGKPDGVRKVSRVELDKKSMNCVMPIMLAAFCAWDGGELARTEDFREVWGRLAAPIPLANGNTTNVYIPWDAALSIGQWNFRNGHGLACNPIFDGCVNPQNAFYAFPAGFAASDDDSPGIGAPGRFPMDVTRIRSANGEGWFDIGGNMMDMAWPVGAVRTGSITDVCDTANGTPGPGETACTRRGKPGVERFSGTPLPQVALIGYSFEAHQRRSEGYLAAVASNEMSIGTGDLKPITFQYGKVGGRCSR